jgi:hypothetical protein
MKETNNNDVHFDFILLPLLEEFMSSIWLMTYMWYFCLCARSGVRQNLTI